MESEMRIKVWLSALGAIVLGACAHDHHHRFGQFAVPDASRPAVVLSPAGQLVVDQEPLLVPPTRRVTWRLPPGGDLSFDRTNGIRVLGRIKNEKSELIPLDTRFNEAFSCAPARVQGGKDDAIDSQAFTCDFPEPAKVAPGFYAYEINVVGPKRTFKLDPTFYPPDH
jgi:hypothetical protein